MVYNLIVAVDHAVAVLVNVSTLDGVAGGVIYLLIEVERVGGIALFLNLAVTAGRAEAALYLVGEAVEVGDLIVVPADVVA